MSPYGKKDTVFNAPQIDLRSLAEIDPFFGNSRLRNPPVQRLAATVFLSNEGEVIG